MAPRPLTLPPLPPQMEALFGSLPEMLDFQRVFLQTLEDRIDSCPDFGHLETPEQLEVPGRLLLSVPCLFRSSCVWRPLSDAALLAGRIFSLLRRPLQTLQRLLCEPQ